jgi:hypothetical protein
MTAMSSTRHVNEKLLPHISTAADEDQLKMIARYKRTNGDGTVYIFVLLDHRASRAPHTCPRSWVAYQ